MPVEAVSRAADWLRPDWRLAGLGAAMSTRFGGASEAPFDGFNLSRSVGDDAAAVAQNRQLFEAAIGARPVYLNQVHGASVVRLSEADAASDAPFHTADASVTDGPGIACTVTVADCLPVLFAAPHARAVGAAHAGWRGLAAGVLEATVISVCELAGCEPCELRAWLGASIGPTAFQVGADVLDAFVSHAPEAARRFVPEREGKWLADLPGLARDRLRAAGVIDITGGEWCTVGESSRFFSYRRDRITGRMAAAVWIEPGR